VGALALNSAYDYHLQVAELQTTHSLHSDAGADGVLAPGLVNSTFGSDCDSLCHEQQSTLAVHVRGVTYASGFVLGVNTLLVGWGIAVRGGDLEPRKARRRTAS